MLKGRLDTQIKQMKEVFSSIYIMIEFFDGHTVEELNRWLSNRRISDNISVYKNARSSSRYPLNLSGLVQLYQERHPKVTFLFSFRQQDTLAYFKYLMKRGGSLDMSKFGEFSNKIENKAKKIQEYFEEKPVPVPNFPSAAPLKDSVISRVSDD